MIDGATREIVHRGAWPVVPTTMRRGADGHQYFLADGYLWRWSIIENAVASVASTEKCTFLTEPSPGLWLFADTTSVYRLRPSR